MKKTPVVPGKPVVMKTREDEEQLVMDWVNLQSTYSDSIRYLIQKEIAENGLRNLQEYIPQNRTIESLKAQLVNVPPPPPPAHNHSWSQNQSNSTKEAVITPPIPEQSAPNVSIVSLSSSPGVVEATKNITVNADVPGVGTSLQTFVETENGNKSVADSTVAEGQQPQRRPAKKKYGAEVASSFAN